MAKNNEKKPVKTPKKKAAAPKPAVNIDYPQEGEQVLPGHYAVRVSAECVEGIEVSINGGEWQDCRNAAGHFWFDWAPAEPGPHAISVRYRKGKTRGKALVLRNCSVQAPLN